MKTKRKQLQNSEQVVEICQRKTGRFSTEFLHETNLVKIGKTQRLDVTKSLDVKWLSNASGKNRNDLKKKEKRMLPKFRFPTVTSTLSKTTRLFRKSQPKIASPSGNTHLNKSLRFSSLQRKQCEKVAKD